MYLFSNLPVRLYNVFVPHRLSDEEIIAVSGISTASEYLSLQNMVLLSL